TISDSIHALVSAYYFLEAESLAARHVALLESRYGPDAAELVKPYLWLVETRFSFVAARRARAIELLDCVEQIGRRVGFSAVEHAAVERFRGVEFYELQIFDSSLAHFRRSADVLAATVGPDHPDFAAALVWQGRSLRALRRAPEAIPLVERARTILEHAYGPEGDSLFECLDQLASCREAMGDYSGALELRSRVLEHQKRHFGPKAPRVAWTYNRMSGLLSDIGRSAEAREASEAAIAIAEQRPDAGPGVLAEIYTVLATAAQDEGNYAEAESLYRKAEEVVTRALSFDSIPNQFTRLNRIELLCRLGRFDEAQRELATLEPVALRTFGPHADIVAWNHAFGGMISLARGDTASARERFLSSLSALRHTVPVERPEVWRMESWLAIVHWLTGEPDRALALAMAVEEKSREHLRLEARSLSDEDALSLESTRVDGLGLALTAVLSGGTSADAAERQFDALVRSRAVVLDAVAARHRAVEAHPDSITSGLLDSLRDVRNQIARLAVGPARNREPAAGEALRARKRALLEELMSRQPDLARALEGSVVGGNEIREALLPGSRLVSFVRFERRRELPGSAMDRRLRDPWYAAFVAAADSEGVRLVDLGRADEIDARIARWRALVSRSEDDPAPERPHLDAVGDSLRRTLWDPLVPPGTGDRLIYVVPDGALALVPFSALPSPDGAYLVERAPAIAYLSAERDLARPPASKYGSGILVLGDPDFERGVCAAPGEVLVQVGDRTAGGALWLAKGSTLSFRGETSTCEEFQNRRFSRLRQSGAEALDIGKLARKSRTPAAILLGPEASEESFKRFAPGRRWIHVASHGFFLSKDCRSSSLYESPLVRSGLALAGANSRFAGASAGEDGVLTAEEVATLDLNGAECVVLSACESGAGEVIAGDGVVGLRRAFQQSGARALLTSLWKVEDSATRSWMREFYRAYLASKLDPASAARQASLAMLQRGRAAGREAAPALWGAFVVSVAGEFSHSGSEPAGR
ncbi:MAG: hypothetical protein A2Z17_06690, partial [Gammaproteobacteria bacterium RBG_16_66_13]